MTYFIIAISIGLLACNKIDRSQPSNSIKLADATARSPLAMTKWKTKCIAKDDASYIRMIDFTDTGYTITVDRYKDAGCVTKSMQTVELGTYSDAAGGPVDARNIDVTLANSYSVFYDKDIITKIVPDGKVNGSDVVLGQPVEYVESGKVLAVSVGGIYRQTKEQFMLKLDPGDKGRPVSIDGSEEFSPN